MKSANFLFIAVMVTVDAPALAQATHAHDAKAHSSAPAAKAKVQQRWGIAGDAKSAKRSIEINMLDAMRFTPSNIEIKRGETIRFVVKNGGKLAHEMVIGTGKSLDEHARQMQKSPHMKHDDPHSVHVEPGKTAELIWHFNRAGDFDFACLVPGHFQAGMRGRIRVTEK